MAATGPKGRDGPSPREFTTVRHFMMADLGLSGLPLLVYARIYEFSRTESVDRLREALGSGNWAIRQGFCYRDLAFIQQVNGGDEWWTLKRDGDAWTGFESWSFGAIAQEPERFERAMRDMCEATPEQCRSGEWAHLHEKAPEPLAQRAASAREASRAHAGQEARAPMARERAVGAE